MSRCYIFLITGALLVCSACTQKQSEPARLQIISMIPNAKGNVTISPTTDTSTVKNQSITYAKPTGYSMLKPGSYNIRFSVEGATLLNHTFVFGRESSQTLLIAGLLPDSTHTNPQTIWYSIQKIFGGSEASDPNGFLPQFIMLRDRYPGSENIAALRFINASPAINTVKIDNRTASLNQSISYPKFTEPITVTAGIDTLIFKMGNVELTQKTISIKDGFIYTILTGDAVNGNKSPTITSYKTATEVTQ